MVDNELIAAISRAVKVEIEPLTDEVRKVNSRLDRLEEKTDKIQEQVDRLEVKVDGLQDQMDGLKVQVYGLKVKTDEIKEDLKGTQLYLKNDIWAGIKVIGEGHDLLDRNLDRALNMERYRERMELQIIDLRREIRNIKKDLAKRADDNRRYGNL